MRLRPHSPKRPRPQLEELEPRILFSADAAAGLFDPNSFGTQAEVRTLAAAPAPQASQVAVEQSQRREVVFIDTRVADYQALVDDLTGRGEVEVFLLDAQRDGVEQVSQVLKDRHDISAVHLIAHGADGQVQLGNAVLNQETLNAQATQISAWGKAFTADADLLIYGCNVAANEDGRELIATFSDLTGADVSASEDLTGHTALGGDWDLEFSAGRIETSQVFTRDIQQNWSHLMATQDVRDNFSSISYSNNDGAQLWSTSWVETEGGGAGPGAGAIQVTGGALFIDAGLGSGENNIYREANLTGALSATLTYSYTASLGVGGSIEVQISDDGGASYTTLATYTLLPSSGSQNFDVTAYISANTRVRFEVASAGLLNNIQFDDVRILYVTNDPPVIANLADDSLSYSEGDGAIVIEQGGNATVSDVDSADFNTGTLTVSFTAGSDSAEDVLAIRNQGTGAGQIGVSGGNVTYGGTTIGTFTGGSSGSNLVITLNSSATPTAVTALVQNITYENTDTATPTTGARTVRFVLTDGDGGSSGNHGTTVTVSALNDAPAITSNGSAATASVSVGENTTAVTTVTSTDVDGGTAVYSIVPVVGGGAADAAKFTINSSTGALSFVTAPDFENPTAAGLSNVYDVTVQASDGNGGTDTQVISVSVVNHPRVYDQFNTVSYGGNDGDQNWLSNWTEIGESNGTGSGVVRVSSSGYMRIGGDEVTISGRGASRAADLSGASYAILSFDYHRVDLDEGGGSISLQVSSDGGSSWNTLTTYSLSSFDGSFVSTSFDISAYATAGTQIRFLGSGSTEAYFRVDNVAIEHDGTASNNAPVITSNGGGGTASISVAEIAIAVTDVNATDPEAPPQTLIYSLSGIDAARFTIDSNTGVLTFASAPDFENPSDSDTDNVYEVTVQLSDGNGGMDTQAISVTLTNVNEAATISNLSGDTLAYSEGAGALAIEQGGNATVSDVDSADFNTGTLTVSFTAGSDSAEDVLAIRNQGTGAGQIGVSGNNVTYGGTSIGTFTGGSGGSNLVITFNSNTTHAAAQALLRNITYENTDNAAPTTGARTVRFVLTDGNGGSSANYDTTVTVSAVNDAPTTAPVTLAAIAEDSGLRLITQAELLANASDVDGPAITATNLAISSGGGSLVDNGDGTWTYTPASNDDTSVSFSYIITDGTASVTGSASMDITPVNDAPLGLPTISGMAIEDQTLSVDTSGISDADGFTALGFSYQWLRDGVAIAGAVKSTYALVDADVGKRVSVHVSYDDAQDTTEGPLTSAQTAPVANVNNAPLGLPVVVGLLAENQTLSAATGGISDTDGLGTFNYQWLRNGTDIVGATAGRYTLVGADMGTQISVRVSYVDGQGTAETLASAKVPVGVSIPTPAPAPIPATIPTPVSAPTPAPTLAPAPPPPAEPPVDGGDGDTGGGTTGGVDDFLGPPPVVIVPPVPSTSSTGVPTTAMSTQHTSNSTAKSAAVPDWMAAEFPQFAERDWNSLGKARSFAALALSGFDADERSAVLARDLDQLRDNLQEETVAEQYALPSAVAVSTGLSVGYVAWLLRGGVLLSTLLSTMPAWRVLDPLSVLARPRDMDEDDESLESMVGNADNAEEPPVESDTDGAITTDSPQTS